MSLPVETTPLFDGLLSITVGGVDVTGDGSTLKAMELRLTTTSRGGFGEASFRLPCTDPSGPYHANVVRGAAVTIVHDTQTLFQGKVSNDIDVATVDDGVAYYDVACTGKWFEADQRRDGLLALCDTDFDQWELSTRGQPSAFDTDNDGRLAIVATKGQAYKYPGGAGLSYWLHKGLGSEDEHIDHLIFVLGDYGDGSGYGMQVLGDWRVSIQRGDSPYDPDLAAQLYWETTQAAAGTIYRVPAAGTSLTQPARCARLRLYPTTDTTPAGDRYVVIREMYLMMSPAYVAVTQVTGTYPATVTTSAAHGLKVGDRVYIYGNSVATYNGIWTILTVPTTATFTIDALGASTGTGGSMERLPSPVDAMVQIGEAIGGAGSNVADSSYADALPGSVMVRSYHSWAEGMEKLAEQFAVPQAWGWWDGGEYRQESIAYPGTADYTVDAKTPGVLYDVHEDDEGQPDYVRVLHKLAHTVGLGRLRLKVTYTPSGGGAQVTVNCPLAFDGRLRSASNVYATACAGGAAVDQVNTDDEWLYVGQNKVSTAPYRRLHEAFVQLTLTGYVPANATVNAATLSGMVKSKQTGAGEFVLYVFAYNFGVTLEAADWRTPAQLQAMGDALTACATTEISPGKRFDFVNEAGGGADFIAAVQAALATGYLRLIVVSSLLYYATSPYGAEYVALWSAEGDIGPDPLVGQVVQTVVAASDSVDPGFEINTEHVDVLNLSDRMLTAADAQAMGKQYLTWCGRYADRGRITIESPTVPLTAGGDYPMPYIRAGERIKELAIDRPHYITVAEYIVNDAKLTLYVGEEEPDEFRPLPEKRAT